MPDWLLEYLKEHGQFWIAAIVGAFVKLGFSERMGFFRAVATVACAIYGAWVFTPLVISIMGLPEEDWTVPIAALCTMTVEGVMRSLITVSGERRFLDWLLSPWRK